MARAAGCRNTIIVIVALAVVGAWWWWFAPPEGGFLHFVASMVGFTSSFILVVTLYAFVTNFGRVVDWFVVPVPPTVHDPALGDLSYDDGQWSTHIDDMRFWLEGRRRGPDLELVRAGAEAVSSLAQYERRARAFALERLASVDSIEGLLSLSVDRWGPEQAPAAVLWFELSDNPEDYLRVILVAGEPREAEAPYRPGGPSPSA